MRNKKIPFILMLGVWQFAHAASVTNSYPTVLEHNPQLKPETPRTFQDTTANLPRLTLNGIAVINGEKYALLKAKGLTGSTDEQSYLLSEGQQQAGIELLSVNVKTAAIKVNNHGVVQTIVLCDAPKILTADTAASFAAAAVFKQTPASRASSNNSAAAVGISESSEDKFQNGSGGTSSSSSGQNESTAKNDDEANENSGDGTSSKKFDPWWVTGSRMVEQARAQSADLVLNGMADPQPLTPLTPPGTPAYLIGPDKLFFNHM